MARSGHAYRGKGALELIEEAMHTLRVCPLPVLCSYYVGTLPFVLGFLFFWSEMSRSSHAMERSVAASLAMMALYFWMKIWQGVFCRKLMAQWTPDAEIVKLTKRQWLRLIATQCFLQGPAIPLHLLALILVLPFGWVYAYFQNLTVLAFSREPGDTPVRTVFRTAARECGHMAAQNHVLILVGSVFAVFVWANVYSVLVVVPILMKQFLGIESAFTTNPGDAFRNTTFFAVSVAVAFLCVSPLVKIVYTLRCFYGLSVTTGADLSRQLDFMRERRAASGKRALTLAAIALMACGWFMEARGAAAEAGGDASVEVISAEKMDAAIDDVIARSEFSWRLPRMRPGEGEGGPVANFFRDIVAGIMAFFRMIAEALGRIYLWILEWLMGRDYDPKDREAGPGLNWGAAMVGLVILLGALTVALVVWLIVWAVRRCRADPETGGAGPVAARVDLESEEIMASQLPEDEWMKLAREQVERGDFRLAVRALFLASLASLGARDLLRIEKSKSNLDYQRELRMRARSNAGLLSAFGENVGVFERAWYGLHDVNREAVDQFTSNYRTITTYGEPATHA